MALLPSFQNFSWIFPKLHDQHFCFVILKLCNNLFRTFFRNSSILDVICSVCRCYMFGLRMLQTDGRKLPDLPFICLDFGRACSSTWATLHSVHSGHLCTWLKSWQWPEPSRSPAFLPNCNVAHKLHIGNIARIINAVQCHS